MSTWFYQDLLTIYLISNFKKNFACNWAILAFLGRAEMAQGTDLEYFPFRWYQNTKKGLEKSTVGLTAKVELVSLDFHKKLKQICWMEKADKWDPNLVT